MSESSALGRHRVYPEKAIALTSDPQLAITVAIISVLGVLFSGCASFAGVYLAQRLTTSREERTIERRRDRVRALFVGRVQNAASYFLFQVQSRAIIIGTPAFRQALEPLRELAAKTELVLDLEPTVITALFKALHVAEGELGLFEMAMREEVPEGVTPSDFSAYRVEKVRILLRDTATAFRELVGAFGITYVPKPELVREIPDMPAPRNPKNEPRVR